MFLLSKPVTQFKKIIQYKLTKWHYRKKPIFISHKITFVLKDITMAFYAKGLKIIMMLFGYLYYLEPKFAEIAYFCYQSCYLFYKHVYFEIQIQLKLAYFLYLSSVIHHVCCFRCIHDFRLMDVTCCGAVHTFLNVVFVAVTFSDILQVR